MTKPGQPVRGGPPEGPPPDPPTFSGIYFLQEPWSQRLRRWKGSPEVRAKAFAEANEESIRRRLDDPSTAARVVVNIWASALLDFLRIDQYQNAYERARVGGPPVLEHRVAVDRRVGIDEKAYFGAVAIGGSGVRYFGEYCMVLKMGIVPGSTRLLDRDSFDVLYSPLKFWTDQQIIDVLGGSWSHVDDMLLMRVLPRIPHDFQVITSGTIIELALTDQEYIEVHLTDSFKLRDISQILDSPESTATEARILERQRSGLSNPMHELDWSRIRARLAKELDKRKVRQRVVSQHGRGYQWM